LRPSLESACPPASIPRSTIPDAPDAGLLEQLLARSTREYLLAEVRPGYPVFDDGAYRWLCYPADAVQSALRLDDPGEPVLPNQAAMAAALALPAGLQRCLDLGSGCGGLRRFLQASVPQAQLTAVEADEGMVELGRRYFGLDEVQGRTLRDDALAFLDRVLEGMADREPGPYDLIFCDLFDGRAEPPWLASQAFYERLRAVLAPGGAVALNLLPATEAQLRCHLEAARSCFEGVALRQFRDLGNIVVFLADRSLPSPPTWQAGLQARCPVYAARLAASVEDLTFVRP